MANQVFYDFKMTEGQDEFCTPKCLVDAVIPYFERWLSKYDSPPTVWCPFDMKHSEFVLALKPYRKAERIRLRYSHIYNSGNTEGEGDFFLKRADFKFDLILSNPPFSKDGPIIKKLAELKKDFCLVFPIERMSTKSFVGYCMRHGREIGGMIIPDTRVSFTGGRPPFKAVFITSPGFFTGIDFVSIPTNTGKRFIKSRMEDD